MKCALRIGFGAAAGVVLLLAGCSSQGGKAGNDGSPGTGGLGSGGAAAGAGGSSGGSKGGTSSGGTIGSGGEAGTGGTIGSGGSAAGSGGRTGGSAGAIGGGGGTTLGTGGGAGTGGTSGSTTIPGCNGNATPPTSPSSGYLTIDVNGTSREYVLELPTGYDGNTPQPVLFAFHGTTSNGQQFIGNYYGGVRKAAAGRVILVAPSGLVRNGQTGWVGSGGIEQVDIDFFDALVAQLRANYCVDPGRIFSMGHSAGAMMSNQLGCVRSDVLRGVGPFAGAGPMEYGGTKCGGKVAAFIGHNPKEGDPTECAKFDGGVCPWVVKWATTGWPTTQFWIKKNGCTPPDAMPTEAFPGDSKTGNPLPCQTLAGCDPSYPLTLCLYDYSSQWDGPHAFPVEWGAKAVTDFFLALPKVE
jgi:poly(3-hydroxybutyrate) depolymerase